MAAPGYGYLEGRNSFRKEGRKEERMMEGRGGRTEVGMETKMEEKSEAEEENEVTEVDLEEV